MTREPGFYVVLTTFGTKLTAYLHPAFDHSHYVDQILAGPYHNDPKIPGLPTQTGHDKAFQALIELQKNG